MPARLKRHAHFKPDGCLAGFVYGASGAAGPFSLGRTASRVARAATGAPCFSLPGHKVFPYKVAIRREENWPNAICPRGKRR